MIDKKYYGNAVEAILITIQEKYYMGFQELKDVKEIINIFNFASYMAATYGLKEIERIKDYQLGINESLKESESDYRIFEENNTYKLVTLA